jgi:pimeloyl-ACP methyl ester carboxylesterase
MDVPEVDKEQDVTDFIPWNSQPLDVWADKYAEGKFIGLEGRRTHFIDTGSGSPILLVHGFFFDSFTWHNNIEALADNFRVLAPDLWGFGYSTREPLDYGYSLYAKQLLLFLDALHIEKASIVGHSMGGGTGIYFAVHHPDRVNKLLLVDAAAMPNPLPLLGKLANLPLVGELMYGMKGNFMRRMALKTNWIYDESFITDSYFENATRFHKVKGSTDVMLTILRKQFFHTLPDEVRALGELNIPTLMVWGRHDTAVPLARGREMHALLKGSRLEVFDNVSHCPHAETFARFNQMAVEFLS